MSQDNQNQDPQDNRQNPGSDDMTRESRPGSSDSPQDQVGSSGPGSSPDLEDTEEMDDEDRDEDARGDGSANRRNNIG